MNTLTQNTASDTPAFLQFNQFESTGIRELTPEEIELISAATAGEFLIYTAAGAATGAATGALFGPKGAVIGGAIGVAGGAIAYFADKEKEDECTCSPCACGI